MSIRVVQLDPSDEWTLKRMRALRERVYGDDDDYCPPMKGALKKQLRHPKFASRQRVFMVRRTGEDVGCVVVRHNDKMALDGRSVATIGNFEALHDPEAAGALLSHAAAVARDEGAEEVIGPMIGDTWQKFRLNLGPWDEPPFFLEPYNPSYYSELWRQAGFEVLQTYRSLRVDDLAGAARYHQPRWASARALGYRIEPMSQSSADEALQRVHEMWSVAFAQNYLYTPIRLPTFKKIYNGLASVVTDAFSLFLIDRHGRDAGFALVFPDYARAVAAMNGKRHLLAKLRFLTHRDTDTVNIKSYGVMPEHRGKGLASAMAHRFFDDIAREGYDKANICLIHDDNDASRHIDAHRGRVLRRYALYRAPE